MRRRSFRILDRMALLLLVWGGAAAIPLEWFWFDPGDVYVANSTPDKSPAMEFDRDIKRATRIKYQIVIRNIDTGRIVCDPSSEPFTYKKTSKLPDPILLHPYWVGGDQRCWPLEPATYIMETCWTATNIFWGVVPPKTACRTSNPFAITALSSGEAERVQQKTRALQSEVEQLREQLYKLEGDIE